jgi:RNA polymerase sigma-70 factor, ECF subfamily
MILSGHGLESRCQQSMVEAPHEGYSASGGTLHMRLPLCEEAIRLARLLLRLFPGDYEVMGLTALLLLQHSRAGARLDADQAIVLLEDQDRHRWDRKVIAEGLVLLEKALRHHRAGPFQVQAAEWVDVRRGAVAGDNVEV